ncbi:hypothetical protein [Paenibacillus sp. 1001270B_150601_E10]|uniref:hypothetical protein n=1 Tax=Paenibacillus sp. 1001270B_150601_E10 TaxID=2787079 RepID=UPI00189D62D9|nr:hypothetical protein [Paenibacillus sp. 1001270B_150601_E10]
MMNRLNGTLMFFIAALMYNEPIQEMLRLPSFIRPLDMLIVVWIAYTLKKGVKLPERRSTQSIQGVMVLFLMLTCLVPFLGLTLKPYTLSELLGGVLPSLRTVLYATAFWLFYHASMRGIVRYKELVSAYVWVSLPHFLYGLLQFISINTSWLPYSSLPWQPVRVRGNGETEVMNYVVTGLTEAPFSLATWGSTSAIVCFVLLMQFPRKLRSLSQEGYSHAHAALPSTAIQWIGLITGLGMVIMSMRRTTLLALLGGMLAVMVLKVVLSRQHRFAGTGVFWKTIIVAGILLAVGAFYSPSIQQRITSIVSLAQGDVNDPSLRNLHGRSEETWGYWIDFFFQNPYGIGLYPPEIMKVSSDNTYLTYLAQGGLVYSLGYIALLLALTLFAFYLFRNPQRLLSAYGLSLFGIMIIIWVSGVGTGGSMASLVWAYRWAFLGCLCAEYMQAVSIEAMEGSLRRQFT